ncbi:hypothetical protein DPMN_075278 [Dreissena polymorpha]|uniref:Uncharacterized protein n=1 Tax=Dreissena polymorpha TaxID=45954 RepID=A0A9D3YLC9_DREPO|nr:hypothetical protein DPMN_075278 [Dreissena polymorpha]
MHQRLKQSSPELPPRPAVEKRTKAVNKTKSGKRKATVVQATTPRFYAQESTSANVATVPLTSFVETELDVVPLEATTATPATAPPTNIVTTEPLSSTVVSTEEVSDPVMPMVSTVATEASASASSAGQDIHTTPARGNDFMFRNVRGYPVWQINAQINALQSTANYLIKE